MLCRDIGMGRHGLRKWPAAWQHQAIACTSADLAPANSSESHSFWEQFHGRYHGYRPSKFAEDFMPKKFHSNIPGTNGLADSCLYPSLWSCHSNTSATLPPCRKYMYVCCWQCITEHWSDFLNALVEAKQVRPCRLARNMCGCEFVF